MCICISSAGAPGSRGWSKKPNGEYYIFYRCIKIYVHMCRYVLIYICIHVSINMYVYILICIYMTGGRGWSKKPNGEWAGACKRAGDITRVDATWTQRDEGPRDPHRGPTQGTHTGDPHRGPTQGTHTEGRAPQMTHHRRGGPTQGTHTGQTQTVSAIFY